MVKNVHICDLCGSVHNKKEELVHFDIRVVGNLVFPFTGPSWFNNKPMFLDICKDCLEKKGFAIGDEMSYSEKEKHNEDTIKDKLLDILSELGIEPEG